jgi:hypothetical protein
VKLPGVHGSSSMTTSNSKATVPANKPVRQQPRGLKMRFCPIGFGDGEPGGIGSSSSSVGGSSSSDSDEEAEEPPAPFRRPVSVASGSSEADQSTDSFESQNESSSSDVEMADAPPLPIAKGRKDEATPTVQSSQEMTSGALKRKYGVGDERKSKHSSSRSSNINDRELKRLKKTQIESQRSLGDRESVSIKPKKSSIQRTPAKAETTLSRKHVPIRPSKSDILPPSSPVPRVVPAEDDHRSPGNPKYKKRDRFERATPARKGGVSLQDLTKATDPSFTGEDRRKKIKKLKSKE